jgi:hypothetical protein
MVRVSAIAAMIEGRSGRVQQDEGGSEGGLAGDHN